MFGVSPELNVQICSSTEEEKLVCVLRSKGGTETILTMQPGFLNGAVLQLRTELNGYEILFSIQKATLGGPWGYEIRSNNNLEF